MAKVVLVTGGSAGIGRAVAAHLANLGYTVYGTSRTADVEMTDDGFRILRMDVTDEAMVKSGMAFIAEKHGKLDVLINNAGLGMTGPLENTSDAEAKMIYDTNVFGVLNTCRHAAPLLRKSQGNVINITSIGGIFGLPYRGIYCSSKFAVEGISEVLSMEMAPQGIKVSIIEPGDFKTSINENRLTSENVNDDVYPKFSKVVNQINREVSSAQDPIIVARTVERILRSSRPKLRYRAATPMHRLSVGLYKLLPGRLFERIIAGHYGVK